MQTIYGNTWFFVNSSKRQRAKSIPSSWKSSEWFFLNPSEPRVGFSCMETNCINYWSLWHEIIFRSFWEKGCAVMESCAEAQWFCSIFSYVRLCNPQREEGGLATGSRVRSLQGNVGSHTAAQIWVELL